MSVLIRSLTSLDPTTQPKPESKCPACPDFFNIIPAAMPTCVYTLYSAPNDTATPNKKAAIVKSIRLINIHPTATVKVTLYFNRPNASGNYRRRLLTPADMALAPNFVYIDDSELTLEPGDQIQGKADTPGQIQFLISGVERDAS